MVLKIGLTGGLASGKSSACQAFKALGITVLDADEIAHQITMPGEPLLQSIIEHFGPDYRTPEGKLNRSLLRTHIFKNPKAKEWLEALLHPAILEALQNKILQAPSSYVILAIPLLIEKPLFQKLVDQILVIDCPPELQLSRALERDQASLLTLEAMIAQQAPRKARLAVADDVLVNDGTPDELLAKVRGLHQKYKGSYV